MRVTARTTDRISLIRELRRVTGEPLPVCQNLASTLLTGESLDIFFATRENPDILLVEMPVDDMSISDIYSVLKESKAAWSLIEKGANGDAAAAIEVCKKLQTHEYAFLFQAFA